jgi:hypothetical protein
MEKAGDGGDIRFRAGAGGTGTDKFPGAPGNFIFELADGSEVMRISGDGVVTVRGEIVESNVAVFRSFLSWLRGASIELESGEKNGGDATSNV